MVFGILDSEVGEMRDQNNVETYHEDEHQEDARDGKLKSLNHDAYINLYPAAQDDDKNAVDVGGWRWGDVICELMCCEDLHLGVIFILFER